MDKKTGIILAVIIALFGGVIGISLIQKGSDTAPKIPAYEREDTMNLAHQNSYDQLDLDKIIPASAASGNMPENIEGDPSAPIKIFEYADYQCELCAKWNTGATELVKKYPGKVAVVFRGYAISYHKNGVMAASAANAAALQGYWPEMKHLLFTYQDDWFSITHDKFQPKIEEYFMEASKDQGDLEKFKSDMASETVAKKVAFDFGLGETMKLEGTPTFYINGEKVMPSQVVETVEKLVKELD